MEEVWAILDTSPTVRQFTLGRTFTIGHVAVIRQWLRKNGFENTLIMERIEGKNIIFLQITLRGSPVQLPAVWLNTIHRKTISHEKLVEMLAEKAKEFTQVA